MLTGAQFILYVRDQAAGAAFYSRLLDRPPRLDVPGMTEFELPGGAVLGLMPEAGIKRLLGAALPDPGPAHGIPRCEIYLLVSDPDAWHRRALQAGGRELDPPRLRDWGHRAGYCLDPDGHVVAFARAEAAGDEPRAVPAAGSETP